MSSYFATIPVKVTPPFSGAHDASKDQSRQDLEKALWLIKRYPDLKRLDRIANVPLRVDGVDIDQARFTSLPPVEGGRLHGAIISGKVDQGQKWLAVTVYLIPGTNGDAPKRTVITAEVAKRHFLDSALHTQVNILRTTVTQIEE